MNAIATTLAAMLAMALAASAFAQTTPNAFGWERGQAVPASAIVKQGGTKGPVKFAYVKPVEGFDEVIVGYADNLGVCAVVVVERLTPSAYRYKVIEKMRKWEGRVVSKFGKIDANPNAWDGRSEYWDNILEREVDEADGRYYRCWRRKKLAPGYRDAQVIAEPHYVRVLFAFNNRRACEPTALLKVKRKPHGSSVGIELAENDCGGERH